MCLSSPWAWVRRQYRDDTFPNTISIQRFEAHVRTFCSHNHINSKRFYATSCSHVREKIEHVFPRSVTSSSIICQRKRTSANRFYISRVQHLTSNSGHLSRERCLRYISNVTILCVWRPSNIRNTESCQYRQSSRLNFPFFSVYGVINTLSLDSSILFIMITFVDVKILSSLSEDFNICNNALPTPVISVTHFFNISKKRSIRSISPNKLFITY